MDRQQPLPEGHNLLTTADARAVLPKKELRLGAAPSLASLTGEYAFFTPALLYLNGIVNDMPLVDFQIDYGQLVPFYYARLPQPFFRGLEHRDGDKDWNHALWAVDRVHWEAFKKFYGAIVIYNEEKHWIYEVGVQELEVADRLSRTGGVVKVTAFGINGNHVRVGFETYPDPWLSPPRARRYAPNPDIGVYADALKAGVNPHTARELFQRKTEAPS